MNRIIVPAVAVAATASSLLLGVRPATAQTPPPHPGVTKVTVESLAPANGSSHLLTYASDGGGYPTPRVFVTITLRHSYYAKGTPGQSSTVVLNRTFGYDGYNNNNELNNESQPPPPTLGVATYNTNGEWSVHTNSSKPFRFSSVGSHITSGSTSMSVSDQSGPFAQSLRDYRTAGTPSGSPAVPLANDGAVFQITAPGIP